PPRRPGGHPPGAEPVPASGQARRLRQPRGRRRLPDLARLDVVVPARLGGQEPDISAVCEWCQRVRQRVEEITVSVAPPEQDRVDHVLVVLADKFHVLALDDGPPQCLITVLCVADLLPHLTRLDAKSLGQVRLVLSLARGRAHYPLLKHFPTAPKSRAGRPPRGTRPRRRYRARSVGVGTSCPHSPHWVGASRKCQAAQTRNLVTRETFPLHPGPTRGKTLVPVSPDYRYSGPPARPPARFRAPSRHPAPGSPGTVPGTPAARATCRAPGTRARAATGRPAAAVPPAPRAGPRHCGRPVP